MNNSFVTLSTVMLISSTSLAVKGENLPKDFSPQQSKAIAFTENKGQVYDQNYKPRTDVLFGAMAGNMAFHLKTNGVSYQLYRVDSYKEVEDLHASTSSASGKKRKEIDQQTIYRIDLNWVNANKDFTQTTDQAFEGYNNYYLESCPKGALNVRSYTGVTLNNLYNGINLHYYEKEGKLKHDYIVAPNTDYKQIQLKVEGASVSVNKDGSLLLTTPLGKIQEGAPIVYQNGKQLKAKWVIKTCGELGRTTDSEGSGVISFEIENCNKNLELIIDPVTRLWGTYYGDAGNDNANSCATDAAGNVYLLGATDANTGTVIATVGAHQTIYGGGAYDAFLVKFNSSGVRQWGTCYGGSGMDVGYSCATDATGNVYIAGFTNSNTSTLIATSVAHQTVYGGNGDAFLVKFDASGVRQWGTYYGGTGDETGFSCSTDATGNVFLMGNTSSNTGTVIATAVAHQTVNGGGPDAFLVKFNSSGVRQWGTYYGGIGNEYGYSCVTDATGNVYFTGDTGSNTGTVIATAGAHQTVFGGGVDVFLVKFNSSGVRQWGTYYGGVANDYGYSCSTDASGNVYLAGYAASNTGTIIATAGAHQSIHGGDGHDAFLVKFDASGVRQWGTYYGGAGSDYGHFCATDATGSVYLGGYTNSNSGTVIATPGSHQVTQGGVYDAFLAQFNNAGIRQSGTYYGGAGTSYFRNCSKDALGNLYLAGMTTSNTGTVIATVGSHQPLHAGNQEAFLVKFTSCVSLNPNVSVSATLCEGAPINLSVNITGTATPAYSWAGPNSYTASVQNPSISNASTVHVGVYTVTVNNAGCIETATTQVSNVYTTPTVSVNNGSICSGNSFTIVPSGSITYTIQGGNFVVSPNTSSSYTITGSSSEGCLSANTATSSIVVNPLPAITVTATSLTICLGESIVLMASGATSYTWSPIALSSSVIVSPSISTVYSVTGQDAIGCENATTFTLNVDACIGLSEYTKSTGIKLYPNPNNGLLYVELPFDATLTILNTLGQIVYNSKYNSGQLQMNLEHLTAGVYVLRVQHEGSIQNFNVIKR
ncbi:MAG: T9SS type A sorting domain-containing protein [Sphingobacteriaceae bacterium]|nr:T9SS type A sorting domain-containing protein [Sphingobacteriaceae bacterium]